jgi:hypothetical protein
MHRFFLYFLDRKNAEKAAASLRSEGFEIWDIQPGWDDPFSRLEVRRELATPDLGGAIERLKAAAGRFNGEYSGDELHESDPKNHPDRPT